MSEASGAASVLESLLRGEWPDPDGGLALRVPLRSVAIERSLVGVEADRVASLGLGRRLAVVSDPVTRDVLGRRVERALAGRGDVLPVVLDENPHADMPTVDALSRASDSADALVAVGSGTINDLCKFAAARAGKPYAVFATAPSMNGYASMNAAITVNGHKMTLPAASPQGVFIDLEVLAAAPPRMIRAGLGDSLCRTTAQADWLLSHLLLGTAYRRAPFELLSGDEPALLDHPEALLAGDIDAMGALARTLVLSGLGMTIAGGSHPASQGEHLVSHYIDMYAPAERPAYFHGEQVAVATLTMARLQEEMLAGDAPHIARTGVSRADVLRRLGTDIGRACWDEFQRKRVTAESAPAFETKLAGRWSGIRERVGRAIIPATRIEAALRRAGGPTTPADIGLSEAFYGTAVRNARFLRDRYTFLDLADDAGLLARRWPAHDSA